MLAFVRHGTGSRQFVLSCHAHRHAHRRHASWADADDCSMLLDGDLAQGWLPPPQRYTHPSINADVHHASTPIFDQLRRRVSLRMG